MMLCVAVISDWNVLFLTFRLKFFKSGETEAVKFRGTRDLTSLTTFINEQLGNAHQVFVWHDLLSVTEAAAQVEYNLSVPKTAHTVSISVNIYFVF
jgi:hypothetical protein